MQIDLENILDHANWRPAGISAVKYELRAEAIKKILKTETEQPPIHHRFGPGGVEMARGRRSLIDIAACRARKYTAADPHASTTGLPGYAIVVSGSYRRRASTAPQAVMNGGGEAQPAVEPKRREAIL